MDFASVSFLPAVGQVLMLASVIVGGHLGIWAVDKVISLIKNDNTNGSSNSSFDIDSAIADQERRIYEKERCNVRRRTHYF